MSTLIPASSIPPIVGFEPFSLVDWPGRVSCVLFLSGCDLRCPTCHNWSLAWNPEHHPLLNLGEVMDRIAARTSWLDGIVISGGEPTFAPGLRDLLSYLSTLGLPLKLDTNGMDPEIVEECLRRDLVELVAVDVKGPWEKYPALTGNRCSAAHAEESLSRLFALARKFPERFLFRTTTVPLLTKEDVAGIRRLLPQNAEFAVQAFVPQTAPTARIDHAPVHPQA